MIRTIVFGGLYWGPPMHGNYQMLLLVLAARFSMSHCSNLRRQRFRVWGLGAQGSKV